MKSHPDHDRKSPSPVAVAHSWRFELLSYLTTFCFKENRTMISLSRPIFGLATLSIVSCGRAGETTHVDQTSSDTATIAPADTATIATVASPANQAQATAQVPLPPPSLTCSPSNFGPNDTLSLHMNVPHGDWLIATQ